MLSNHTSDQLEFNLPRTLYCVIQETAYTETSGEEYVNEVEIDRFACREEAYDYANILNERSRHPISYRVEEQAA